MAKAEEEEQSRSGILTKPMDERRHWQLKVRMVIRRDFRILFGSVFADGCGFFVDRHLSHAVHAFMDWLEYPKEHGVLKRHSSFPRCCAISNDGCHLFVGYLNSIIEVWNLLNRKMLIEWKIHSRVNCLDYQSGVLVGGCKDSMIRVWNPYNYQITRELIGNGSGISGIHFSDDGSKLITLSNDHIIWVWIWETGESLMALKGHTDSIVDAVFIGDSHIVSISDDSTIKVWNYVDGSQIQSINETYLSHLTMNSDRSMIATSGMFGASIYRWPGMDVLLALDLSHSECGIFHPLKKEIFVMSECEEHSIQVWDISKQRCIHTIPNSFDGYIQQYSFHFTPDGTQLIAYSMDKRVLIWDLSDLFDSYNFEDRV